ncbi:DUF2683 family protein [Pedobacter sp. SL55]|uniref:DUF2683 family protein n=1 Tax=Pedobacter sp. SL55 TaxID=2995161 RepID=UPI0022710B59|nr:DUF2683 family protein [Pedobacter sp. SL55]WAC40871.1 hypothetical protein OVA16_00340 [Pedobacter sp. SL55]
MEALIIYPENADQLAAVKAVMKAMKITFKEKTNVYPPSVLDGVREAVMQVNEEKIHPYISVRDMLDKNGI